MMSWSLQRTDMGWCAWSQVSSLLWQRLGSGAAFWSSGCWDPEWMEYSLLQEVLCFDIPGTKIPMAKLWHSAHSEETSVPCKTKLTVFWTWGPEFTVGSLLGSVEYKVGSEWWQTHFLSLDHMDSQYACLEEQWTCFQKYPFHSDNHQDNPWCQILHQEIACLSSFCIFWIFCHAIK